MMSASLGGSSIPHAPRPFSLLYNSTKGKHPDSAKRRFWAIHDHAMPAPVSVPDFLLRRQLLRARRFATVFDFEQVVPASVTNEQIGTAFTDRVKQLHSSASAAKGCDHLALVGINLSSTPHANTSRSACINR